MLFVLVGLVTLVAQEVPVGDDLWKLGGYAVALIAGFLGAHKLSVLPARKDRDAERAERIESQKQERETLMSVLPALQGTQEVVGQVLAILPSLEELVAPRSAPSKRTRQ